MAVHCVMKIEEVSPGSTDQVVLSFLFSTDVIQVHPYTCTDLAGGVIDITSARSSVEILT